MNKQIFDYPIESKCKVGDMIGNWKIISLDRSETNDYKFRNGRRIVSSNFWICECQCKYHTRKVIKESWLLKGQKPQCDRCYSDENPGKYARGKDYTGMRIGFVEVIKPHEYSEQEREEYKRKHGRYMERSYDCACHRCGRGVTPRTDYFVLDVPHIKARMKSKNPSCGCYNKDMLNSGGYHTTHGMNGTRLYNIWRLMRSRCSNPNLEDYRYYGGKGVRVCDEWMDNFHAFYEWAMSHGYRDDLTIDRIDTNGNYEPSNCRWATMKQQMNNTTRNHIVNIGNEQRTLSQAAGISVVNYSTYQYRQSKDNWSENDKLFIPTLNSHYASKDQYRKEHGIVNALIFNITENETLNKLSQDMINNILDKAPTAEEVFKRRNNL